MSSVAKSSPTFKFHQLTARQFWCVAAIAPIVLAPVWLAVPESTVGPFGSFSGFLLALMLLVSTITDLRYRKIYNCVTYTTFGWAIANNWASEWWTANQAIGLSSSLAGGVVCFLVMLIPYSLARGGAGDVKLATAIGALVGMDAGLLIIAFTYIVAATAIFVWNSFKWGPHKLFAALFRTVATKLLPQVYSSPSDQQRRLLDQPIPLAGFFLIATALVLFDFPMILRSL